MEEPRKLTPTVGNTNPYQWEMQLLAQEFNEREANSRGSNNDSADQASLQEHNIAVAELEDRKRRDKAALDVDQNLEIDVVNKKYVEKSQALEADYTKKREDLETELFKKSGKSYKRLQELHAKNLLQSQEFERKAKDILQRMSKSLKEENTISTLDFNLALSVTATGAAFDTPPTSSVGESTNPVGQIERVIQDQYLLASPDDDESLFVDSPVFEPRVPPPMRASLASYPLSANLQFRPSPNDDHSIKRQKTKDLSSTLIKSNTTLSMNDVSKVRDPLSIYDPTQLLNVASDKPCGSNTKSCFPSTKTADQDCNPSKENETNSENFSVSPISVSTRLQPAHTQGQGTMVNSPTLDEFSNIPPAFAQVARRSHSSLQISSPLISAPRKTFFSAGLADNASNMEEKQRADYRKGQKITPLKRKVSDTNLSNLYDDIEISKTRAPTQIRQKPEEMSRVREVRRSATNPSSASGADRDRGIPNSQFVWNGTIKEPTPRVTGTVQSMNAEPARMTGHAHRPSNAEAIRSTVLTPRHSNVGTSRRTTSGTRSVSSEPFRPVAITHKPSIAETRLSFAFIPIEYISYDAGAPTRCYPVTWAGTKGIHNSRQQVSHNYRLQVMHTKNGFLHPYDGADDKSSQYPKLVVDNSWVLGGFYHRESGNCRIEIYRPRSKKEYRVESEEDFDPANIQSARLRIEFAKQGELDHFLQWYKQMHPGAEIRPNGLLGSLRGFHNERGESDRTLRREIENRAQRLTLVAPVALMT
ncbi:hypothetical protein BOTCAL_0060g00040 [Botryotinia calthae]|uniref:Uncharacterized protein n=1 Tax=Botryotinia calthae TaxID=38488 RepID=A0A4Y8DAD8_9HELO|nr:hypothetical protein BOTCAL_0060g00040 [Botryotinia calthae]